MPATVEFADMAAGRGDTKSLLDVSAYRNADALLHVVRAFRDPSVPHPNQSVDPARDVRTIEEELILADLGVVERRLERLEKDLKKNALPDLARERDVLVQCRARLEDGRALRTLAIVRRRCASAARVSVPVGEAAAARRERGRVGRRRRRGRRAYLRGLVERRRQRRACDRRVREDRARDRRARTGRRRQRSSPISA